MSQPSIPDRAAMTVNMIEKARERIADVRRADGEWTTLSLLLNDVEGIASAGLQTAHSMALRVYSTADTEARRVEGKKR